MNIKGYYINEAGRRKPYFLLSESLKQQLQDAYNAFTDAIKRDKEFSPISEECKKMLQEGRPFSASPMEVLQKAYEEYQKKRKRELERYRAYWPQMLKEYKEKAGNGQK